MTRGIVMAVKDKKIRLASESRGDSYPGGLGVDLLALLKEEGLIDGLCRNIGNAGMVSEGDIMGCCYEAAYGKGHYMELPYDVKELLRNAVCVAKGVNLSAPDAILASISRGDPALTIDSTRMAADSLHCEYGYVIDLDWMTLEVYKGFNGEPLRQGDRFKPLEGYSPEREKMWYPIRLLCGFPLAKLPSEEDFLKSCDME